MKAFIEPLQELSGYEDMTKAAMQPGLVTISGCIDAQKPHMIYTLGRTRSRRLIVTFHEQKAKELYDDYRFLIHQWCIIRQRMCCFINRISAETFLPQSGSVHCGQFMKMNR